MHDFKRWTDDLVVGGRIAAKYGRDRYEFGTVTELGKPRGRYASASRPGYVKVEWDNATASMPTKFNSSGDAWGTGGRSYYSMYSWSLMNAEQAVKGKADAEREAFNRKQRSWISDQLERIKGEMKFPCDVPEIASQLRELADTIDGEWIDGLPITVEKEPTQA